MAITVNSVPNTTFAAYNHATYDVSSDNANITRIIADIYIDGVYQTTIEKSPKLTTSDQFLFDIRSVAQDYLSSDFKVPLHTIDTIFDCTNSAKDFRARFFELETSGAIQVTTWAEDGAGTNFKSSTLVYGINNARQFDEAQNLDVFTDITSAKQLLTNRTYPHKVTRGHLVQFDFVIPEDPSVRIYAGLKQFDSNDSVVTSGFIPDQTGVTITNHKGASVIDTGAMATNVTYFTIQFYKDSNPDVIVSTAYRVNIEEACNDDFPLYWQNSLGGFDYYNFKGKVLRSYRPKSSNFQRVLESGFKTYDRGVKHHTQQTDEVYELFTFSTRTDLQEYLFELQANKNDVYTKIGSNYIPVIVMDNPIIVSDSFEPVFEISLKVMIANRHIAQRG